MARKFFFACAGILALAVAFHLGASSAHGQGNVQLVDTAWRQADGHAYAVTRSGEIWANPGYCGSWMRVGQMPAGCVPVCVLDGFVGGSLDIGCENGDFYTVVGSLPSVQVVLCSSIAGSAVPAQMRSWGSLKVGPR